MAEFLIFNQVVSSSSLDKFTSQMTIEIQIGTRLFFGEAKPSCGYNSMVESLFSKQKVACSSHVIRSEFRMGLLALNNSKTDKVYEEVATQ